MGLFVYLVKEFCLGSCLLGGTGRLPCFEDAFLEQFQALRHWEVRFHHMIRLSVGETIKPVTSARNLRVNALLQLIRPQFLPLHAAMNNQAGWTFNDIGGFCHHGLQIRSPGVAVPKTSCDVVQQVLGRTDTMPARLGIPGFMSPMVRKHILIFDVQN